MNAGAALYIGEKASSLDEGVKLAAKLIDEGKAYKALEAFIKESNN
jgi:anthranilate phosphoribosyltransferase